MRTSIPPTTLTAFPASAASMESKGDATYPGVPSMTYARRSQPLLEPEAQANQRALVSAAYARLLMRGIRVGC